MDDRIILHLIRHEKTQANIERKYIGWTDEPIVTHSLDVEMPIQPNIVYGSDLIRCQQTAKLYFPQADFSVHQTLRETNFGDFEMKTYDELQHNLAYRAWIDNAAENHPTNGECFHDFETRVLQGVRNIVQKPGHYTFVVHGGVIRVLLAQFTQQVQDFQQVMANHRTLYKLEWSGIQQWQGGAPCKLFSEEPITVKDNMSTSN